MQYYVHMAWYVESLCIKMFLVTMEEHFFLLSMNTIDWLSITIVGTWLIYIAVIVLNEQRFKGEKL